MRRNLARVGLVAVLLLTVATVGALLMSALASHLPTNDPDDTRGPFDVRRVEVLGDLQPRWKVITWPRWSTASVWDSGYATIYVDTFGTPRPDFYILVGSAGNRMYAHLYRDRAERKDLYRGEIDRVGRSDKRSFFVRVKLARLNLGDRRTLFRWRVETLFTGEGCRRVCFDLAPDTGTVIEPLPVETPTPTPTPTPSPTD